MGAGLSVVALGANVAGETVVAVVVVNVVAVVEVVVVVDGGVAPLGGSKITSEPAVPGNAKI